MHTSLVERLRNIEYILFYEDNETRTNQKIKQTEPGMFSITETKYIKYKLRNYDFFCASEYPLNLKRSLSIPKLW